MADFTCKRCGGCCGHVPWRKSEYKAVRSVAEKLRVSFMKQNFDGHIVYLTKKHVAVINGGAKNATPENMACPFIGTGKDGMTFCKVYEYRPEICRIFGSRPDLSEHLKCPNQEKQ